MPMLEVPMSTEWLPIKEFPDYWVSNTGRVFSMRTKKLVKTHVNNTGIRCVSLYQNARTTRKSLNKLIRETWGWEAKEDNMFSWACAHCPEEFESKILSEIHEFSALHMQTEHPRTSDRFFS